MTWKLKKVCCEMAMTVGDKDLFLDKAQMARCQRDFVAKFNEWTLQMCFWEKNR